VQHNYIKFILFIFNTFLFYYTLFLPTSYYFSSFINIYLYIYIYIYIYTKEELLRVKEQRNILHEISKRKANWIGHILRRNFLLQVIEGKIKGRKEVTGRRGRRRRKLLDDLKEREGTLI
jgi:predicted membrane protein